MPHITLVTITASLTLLFLAPPATAQEAGTPQELPETASARALPAPAVVMQDNGHIRSRVKGLSVGVHGSTTALSGITSRGAPSIGGLALAIGYGVTDRIAVHGATSGAWVDPSSDRDTFFLSHVDLEGRHSFGQAGSPWRPHVAIGLNGRTEHHEAPGGRTVARMSVRPATGAGISYSIVPSVALDGSLRYTLGGVQRTRASVGVSWYPRAR